MLRLAPGKSASRNPLGCDTQYERHTSVRRTVRQSIPVPWNCQHKYHRRDVHGKLTSDPSAIELSEIKLLQNANKKESSALSSRVASDSCWFRVRPVKGPYLTSLRKAGFDRR
jgi:hypothetical protein